MERNEWVVMFVDMEGSTQLKYREGAEEGMETTAKLVDRLFHTVESLSFGRRHTKFTGDGAMAIFDDKDGNGYRKALGAAERIMLRVDRDNLRFDLPRIHIRIGVAAGDCYTITDHGPEISGRAADLASRLCGEAQRDEVLVDQKTKEHSELPDHRFEPCSRRLSLKGVPADKSQPIYTFKFTRLVRPTREEPFDKGFLALYPSRTELHHDFAPTRQLRLAKRDSSVLVAGRTLKGWTGFDADIRAAIVERGLSFQFLLSSEEACSYLVPEQQKEIKEDLPIAQMRFRYLAEAAPEKIEVRESDQLILDGLTCVEIYLPTDPPEDDGAAAKLVVLQDLNAAPGADKATAAWVCTCPTKPDGHCTAHGLYDRTKRLFDKARKLT